MANRSRTPSVPPKKPRKNSITKKVKPDPQFLIFKTGPVTTFLGKQFVKGSKGPEGADKAPTGGPSKAPPPLDPWEEEDVSPREMWTRSQAATASKATPYTHTSDKQVGELLIMPGYGSCLENKKLRK